MDIEDNARRSNELLVQELERLVSAGATGTLFVRTPDDHLGCVVVANGEIVSVTIRGSRGIKGVDYLRSVGHSNFHFDEGTLLWEDPGDLPDTQGILHLLENTGSQSAVVDDVPEAESMDIDLLFDDEESETPALTEVPEADDTDIGAEITSVDETDEHPLLDAGTEPTPNPPEVRALNTGGEYRIQVLPPTPRKEALRAVNEIPKKRDSAPQPRPVSQPTPVRQQEPLALSASEVKRTVAEAAAAVMGPVGRVICDVEFQQSGILRGIDDLETLLRRISRDMEDDAMAREFRNTVLLKATKRNTGNAPRGLREGTAEYQKVREAIESEAVEYLGPLASVLCEEYFNRYSAGGRLIDIGKVINSLVDDIGDLRRGEEFRERIAQRLG